MNKQTFAYTLFGLALISVLIFGTSSVSAHWFGFGNSNLSDLTKKLGVGEDKIKQAFATIQSERQKQMRTLFEERLTQMVIGGKITQSQKQAILKKHDELQAKRNNQRQELENWAKQNNIDLNLFGGFGHKGMHRWMMK